MRKVTVKKDELRARVQANRDAHEEIFDEAVKGYKDQAVTLLEQHIERIKKGGLEQVYVSLPVPVNHIKDYDRVLTMIDMSIEDEFELDEHTFASYVMDDWDWKRQFLTSNASYSETASSALASSS